MKMHRSPHSRLRAALAQAPRRRIQPRERQVLCGIRDGLVDRNPRQGDLGPWIGTQQMNWLISVLVLQSFLRFGAFGFWPPQITARGLRMLNSRADLPAFGDQQ
jgi:hypothetical protein